MFSDNGGPSAASQLHEAHARIRELEEKLAALSTPAPVAYDFDAEARTVCEAIGSDVGWRTVWCALREAYAAGQSAPAAATPAGLVAIVRRVLIEYAGADLHGVEPFLDSALAELAAFPLPEVPK